MSDTETLYAILNGPVRDYTSAVIIKQLDSIISPKSSIKRVYLVMNSPGGSINAGITLYNYLRGMPVEVITHNIGQSDSICNVVFLAGDKRYAAPATSFLLHGISFSSSESMNFSRSDIEERLSQIKQDEKRIRTIFAERTTIKSVVINRLFKSGRSLGTDEALELGLIHRIRHLDIPSTAQRVVLDTLAEPGGSRK